MRISRPGSRSFHAQQGSILLPAALAVLLGLLLLWGAQLGYAMYLKRDLQKTADLAALTGAQVLAGGTEPDCQAAIAAARAAVAANMSSVDDGPPACVRWDKQDSSLAPRYVRQPMEGERFNAVHVVLSVHAPSLFPFTQGSSLWAEAVAARPAEPVAAFSVGTRLASARPGVLTNLLKGVGLDITDTALLGYDAGLANVKITPGGLLQQLGVDVAGDISVADLNQLLAANVSALGDVLDAIVRVANRGELLAANVGLLQAIQAQLGIDDLNVRLGSDEDGRTSSLFAKIVAPDAQSALNVEVNALDLIAAAIGVGTGGHAVQAAADVDLGGLVTVSPRFSVVEPPSIAIGGAGATAYTAQVRVYAPIRISTAPLLGNLVNLTVDLPITVDVVDGKATLEELCRARDSGDRDLATISVRSSVIKVCVGGPPPGAGADWPFSTAASCDEGLTRQQLVNLSVLGVPLATLNPDPPLTVDPLEVDGRADFYVGQTRQVPETGNPLALGDTLKHVTDALLAAILTDSLNGGQTLSGSQNEALRNRLATNIWNETAAEFACNPSPAASGSNCRRMRYQAGLQAINDASSGLGGFLGGLTGSTLGVLGNLLTLNIPGVLNSVGSLLDGVLSTVGGLLGGLGDTLGLNPCTSPIFGSPGNCVNELGNALKNNANAPAVGNPPNAVVALVGFLLDALQPLLDGIGAAVLQPVIENVIGLQVGQTDVNLMSLDCNGKGVQLVY